MTKFGHQISSKLDQDQHDRELRQLERDIKRIGLDFVGKKYEDLVKKQRDRDEQLQNENEARAMEKYQNELRNLSVKVVSLAEKQKNQRQKLANTQSQSSQSAQSRIEAEVAQMHKNAQLPKNHPQVKEMANKYMQSNVYLVPQPGTVLHSASEAMIKESPQKVLKNKISLAEYTS